MPRASTLPGITAAADSSRAGPRAFPAARQTNREPGGHRGKGGHLCPFIVTLAHGEGRSGNLSRRLPEKRDGENETETEDKKGVYYDTPPNVHCSRIKFYLIRGQ